MDDILLKNNLLIQDDRVLLKLDNYNIGDSFLHANIIYSENINITITLIQLTYNKYFIYIKRIIKRYVYSVILYYNIITLPYTPIKIYSCDKSQKYAKGYFDIYINCECRENYVYNYENHILHKYYDIGKDPQHQHRYVVDNSVFMHMHYDDDMYYGWVGVPYINNSTKNHKDLIHIIKSVYDGYVTTSDYNSFIKRYNEMRETKNYPFYVDYSILPTKDYIHTQFDICVGCGCKKFTCVCDEEYEIRIGLVNIKRFISLFF